MPFLDHPFAYDHAIERENREHDEHQDALSDDHARDEKAGPQLGYAERDDRRAAA